MTTKKWSNLKIKKILDKMEKCKTGLDLILSMVLF
jgi:hypothetical protein